MAKNTKKKQALEALDAANKEYKQVCSELKKEYKILDQKSDSAMQLISDVEKLIESIRHRPWSYKAIKHKISVKKKRFLERRDLERKERNKNITAGVVAGGVLAGGLTFVAFMKDIFKKNIILGMVCLILIVFVLAAYLIFKLFNSIKTAKKAYEQIKLIKEETDKNRRLIAETEVLIKKIESIHNTVESFYKTLEVHNGSSYKELSEANKDGLGALYHHTLALTELVNGQVG